MNPNAKEFLPNQTESYQLSLDQLSKNQAKILQQMFSEWTSTPTLDMLLNNWEERKKKTTNMLNVKSDVRIMLLNVSSLKLYLPEILLLLEKTPCPIVVLNGTHHNDEATKIFSKHFSNYYVYSEKGTNNFGGVLIAIHRSIPVHRVNTFQHVHNVIVLDVGISSDKFQLATCYSPPNENLPISLFDVIMKRNKNTILLGDFNAKHQSWSLSAENQKGKVLYNWLSTNSLEIVNKHVATSTRSNATIDVILAPTHMRISSSFSVLPSIGNDHFPVVWDTSIRITKKDRLFPIKRTYWLLIKLFLTYTYSYWNNFLSQTMDCVSYFSTYERFLSLLASRVTIVSYQDSYRPSLPPYIVKLIQDKNALLQLARKTKHPFMITQLKTFSIKIRKEIFAHRRLSWRQYCQTLNTGNTNQFWRKARKHFSTASPSINGFLLPDNTIVSSSEEMCNLAESFYEDQFSAHNCNSTQIESEADNVVRKLVMEISSFSLQSNAPVIKPFDITKTIRSLRNKSSFGIDCVSNKIIKLFPVSHHAFVSSSFNYFMSNVLMPPQWKTAKMILLSKIKTSVVNVNDTRPISLLPCYSKLYEKIFLTYFNQWIRGNGILPEEQTGFRTGHNMAVRLISIIDQIGQSLSVNTAAAGLFIDFKSAFNQLWFNGLILKLQRLDCPKYLMAWLYYYLSDRTAYIDIGGTTSSKFSLHKGVLQGSCVGPIIFIVFHYDILNSISMLHHKHLFADDLGVLITPSAHWSSKALIPMLMEKIRDVMKALMAYADTWKQPINYQKTFWVLFHRQVAPKFSHHIDCDGHLISYCDKIKYLGTLLDNKLSFSSHLKYIESKIRKNVTIFRYLNSSRMISEPVAYRLYNAFIRPHYQSLLNIYPILTKTKQIQLESLNRQIFRNLHHWYDATNEEISQMPKFKSIDELTRVHWSKIIQTIISTNPSVLTEYFQYKMYLLFINEYYRNPLLIRERRAIVTRGRTSKRILSLFQDPRSTLLDHVLAF